MAQRHYTDQQVAGFLAILTEQGGNVSATARVTGVPRSTLIKWRNGERRVPQELVAEAKAALADLFERQARAAVERADETLAFADYRAAMTGAGIAVDKMLLLRGEPTERGEQTVRVVINLGDG